MPRNWIVPRNLFSFCFLFSLASLNFLWCGADIPLRAPSVFRSDESEMHRYSAVLAATEPFRIQCLSQIRKAMGPFRIIAGKFSGKSILDQGHFVRNVNLAVDNALTKFEQRLHTTLRSYGMTVQEFNSVSSLLNDQKPLKKRVLLQAYLYKIAADLEMNLRKAMPVFPNLLKEKDPLFKQSAQSVHSSGKDEKKSVTNLDVESEKYYVPEESNTLTLRFAKSLRRIERERLKVREFLKKSLNLRELPPRIADPEYLPAMAPIIQKSCKDFPLLITEIVERNGLHIEEFNALQEKLHRNFFFRYQVMKEINRLENKTNHFNN